MEVGLNFKDTELCLGLPGGGGDNKSSGKRGFSDLKETVDNSSSSTAPLKDPIKPPAK